MNYFLLFAELAPAEKTLRIIGFVVIGLLAALVIAAAATGKKAKFDTRSIVYGGICVAVSYALSFFKIGMQYGGSVTPASMLPLFLYCYVFGIGRGSVAGLAYGILQYFQPGSYVINVPQFFLDYIIAFTAICLVSVFKKMKSKTAGVLLGTALFSVIRLASHVAAGIYFFYEFGPISLPLFGLIENSAFLYSLLYNSIYMVPETLILMAALASLTLTKTFDRLVKTMSPPRLYQPAAENAE